jgi:GGDEF domain-containing protein
MSLAKVQFLLGSMGRKDVVETNVEELHKKIEDLQKKIDELSRDAVYGVWTRPAFLQFCKVMPRGVRAVVFLDFDRIHELNGLVGYKEVDRRINNSLNINLRSSDLIARWYSGDELVILFDGDLEFASRKINELRAKSCSNGLSFKYSIGIWEVGKKEIESVIDDLSENLKRKSLNR